MSEKRFRLDYEEDDAIFIVEDDDIVYPIRNDTIKKYELQRIVDKLNEQQATIDLLLNLLYQSEATVIHEYSSHIGEDMGKLDKIFKEKDIKEIERFVRGCDDE
jgi:hypothetical protein